MILTTDRGSQTWVPRIDYLIGDGAFTTAHCMYCFTETEWTSHLLALNQILQHLAEKHQDRQHAWLS